MCNLCTWFPLGKEAKRIFFSDTFGVEQSGSHTDKTVVTLAVLSGGLPDNTVNATGVRDSRMLDFTSIKGIKSEHPSW